MNGARISSQPHAGWEFLIALELPPATTLAAQLILGALSGIAGVTFATPLVAAIVPIIRMTYLEDASRGQRHAADRARPPVS